MFAYTYPTRTDHETGSSITGLVASVRSSAQTPRHPNAAARRRTAMTCSSGPPISPPISRCGGNHDPASNGNSQKRRTIEGERVRHGARRKYAGLVSLKHGGPCIVRRRLHPAFPISPGTHLPRVNNPAVLCARRPTYPCRAIGLHGAASGIKLDVLWTSGAYFSLSLWPKLSLRLQSSRVLADSTRASTSACASLFSAQTSKLRRCTACTYQRRVAYISPLPPLTLPFYISSLYLPRASAYGTLSSSTAPTCGMRPV
ncbi:hypothetical protein DFH06DRAFT_1232900 [Mycena polygramma]|nr:hypothetical protein DFH06DRAFT_1232900 [Mycena polygramma]